MFAAQQKRKLKERISCCHCDQSFMVQEAEMCSGCNPCVQCRNARSADERCMFGCGTQTLTCPHCCQCACSKIDEWAASGRIVAIRHDRFGWVHRDLIA